MNWKLNFATIFIFAGSSDAFAQATHAATNPSITYHDIILQTRECNRHNLVDAYRAVGHTDPKWDAAAVSLLELQAQKFDFDLPPKIYPETELPKLEDCIAAADAAEKSGCNDPLVLDAIAEIRGEQGLLTTGDVMNLARKSAVAMVASRYRPDRIADSLRRALHRTQRDSVAQNDKPTVDKLQQQLFDFDLQTIQLKGLTPIDRRSICHEIDNDILVWSSDRLQNFINQIDSQHGDAALAESAKGWAHIRIGWNARGNGFANTVTEAGEKTLLEQVKLAAVCYAAARDADTQTPGNCACMENIAMGGVMPSSEFSYWFDQATARQFDYYPAYTAMLNNLSPKWFGSEEQKVEFGLKCVATKRYDTLVPYMLVEGIQQMIVDDRGDWRCIRLPGVAEGLQEMLNGYADTTKDKDLRSFYLSQLVGFSWQMHRFDIGHATLNKLNGRVDPKGVRVAEVCSPRIVSGIEAFSGPHVAELKAAETLASAGDFDRAAAVYTKIASALGVDDPATVWCQGRAQEFTWQAAFEKGDWVDLQTPNLVGWYSEAGIWSSDPQGITGKTDTDGASLWCGLRLGPSWELNASVQVPDDVADQKNQSGLAVGLEFDFDGGQKRKGFFAQPGIGQMCWRYAGNQDILQKPYSLPASMPLQLKFVNGYANGTLDKVVLYNNAFLRPIGDPANQHLALASNSPSIPGEFKITHLRVRKIAS